MYTRLLFVFFIFKSICGDDIAQRLIERYNDRTKVCVDNNNNTTPAYECSGIILRGLANIGGPQQKYAWSKKESNIRKNAFSAGYLRIDSQFNRLPAAYESGFIYYPQLKNPNDKFSYPAYCAFPIDGWSDEREGEHVCGKLRNDTTGRSIDCAEIGVTSLEKWVTHFEVVSKDREERLFYTFGQYQCSFDMTTKDAPANFALVLEVKDFLRQNSKLFTFYHNEIVIQAWDESDFENFPIEAFFYLIGKSSGRDKAFMYQRDYLGLTGKTIPVVGIRFRSRNDSSLGVVLDEQ